VTDAVDLFAGCRGWEALDPDDSLGIDNLAAACATSLAAGLPTLQADLLTVDADLYAGVRRLRGSPPCQPASAAASSDGRATRLGLLLRAVHRLGAGDWPTEEVAALDDPRTVLTLEPLRWALMLRPRTVALEQVPGVRHVWAAMADVLADHGYQVAHGVVHAEQYGVPQARDRAVLLASLDGPVALPAPTHSRYHRRDPKRLDDGVLPWVSMAEALGWTEAEAASRMMAGEGDLWRWAFQRPATTAVGTYHPEVFAAPGWRKAGDPPRQRTPGSLRVTLAEALTLQSFPADWPLQGSEAERWLQVGNAVPPLLGRALRAAVGDA